MSEFPSISTETDSRTSQPLHPRVQHDSRGPGPSTRSTKVAAYQIFETTVLSSQETRQRILQETAGHYIGPMPVTKFLDEFMPWNKEVPEEWKEVSLTQERLDAIVTLPQCNEAQSYPQIGGLVCKAGMEWLRALHLPSGSRIAIIIGTGTACPSALVSQCTQGLGLFPAKPGEEHDAFDDGPAAGEDNQNRSPHAAPQVVSDEGGDAQYAEGEDHRDPNLDVAADSEDPHYAREFEDRSQEETRTTLKCFPSFPFENGSARGCDTRAWLASYAGAVMATQYRNHLFTLLIAGKRARFIRWERASAVVTEAFDFTERPLLLFEYFKRFRQLTQSQRGSNPHITPATKKDAQLARTLLQNEAPELWLGLAGRVHLKHDAIDINTQPFLKFEFDSRLMIIPAPHCHERDLSPFGSASRGVSAIALEDSEDPIRGSICFLKDGWRDLHRPSEHELYQKLHSAGVRNIAEILCGGDWISNQLDGEGKEVPNAEDFSATVGHVYALKPWVRHPESRRIKPQKLQKNIIALNVIGMPLRAFRKAYELVGGLADAMEAYEDALLKAKIMHRDISANNILLIRNVSGGVRGILIDWDHSVTWDPSSGKFGSRRTGTWRYMSIALLRNVEARHIPIDDRESLLYVLLWVALCYLSHNLSRGDLRLMLESFDEYSYFPGKDQFIGGDSKEVRVLRRMKMDYSFKFQNVKLAPLARLIRELALAFKRRYGDEEVDEEDPHIKATVGNGEWLLSKLRDAHRELKDVADLEEDWVNNMPDKDERVLPAYLSHLVRSHFHWASNTTGTLKRTVPDSTGESDQEKESEERQAKRVKASDRAEKRGGR